SCIGTARSLPMLPFLCLRRAGLPFMISRRFLRAPTIRLLFYKARLVSVNTIILIMPKILLPLLLFRREILSSRVKEAEPCGLLSEGPTERRTLHLKQPYAFILNLPIRPNLPTPGIVRCQAQNKCFSRGI